MIHHTIAPRSVEWFFLRLGLPTSSEFHKILTPTGKISEQAEGYMYEILAELMVGHPISGPETEWMTRGVELEDDAVRAYEFQREVETQLGGFVTTDDGAVGASPDRLVGVDGLLEIKCPAPHTHIGYLFGNLDKKYKPQTQGQLYVTGRDYVDICSYHPEMPLAVIRITRDEKYIADLATALKTFVELLAVKRAELEQRYGSFVRPEPGAQPDHSKDWITQADIDAILNEKRANIAKLRSTLPVFGEFPEASGYHAGDVVNVRGKFWLRAMETATTEWEAAE